MRFGLLLLCAVICFLHPVRAQVLLTAPPESSNEPSMALHRGNPNLRLVGANVNQVYRSEDGGLTWQKREVKSDFGFYGDPVLLSAASGSFYLCHLARNSKLTWPEWFDRIVVHRSDDSGKTFNSGTGVGFQAGKVQDKPWMCLDERAKSPYRGRLYLSWTEFDRYGSADPRDSSRIRFAYSDNQGDTFSQPVVVSDDLGDCADGDSTVEGATIAVNREGVVYLCWAARNKIYLDKSTDGGKTWGQDVVIATQHDGWKQEYSGVMRANSLPFLVADAHGGLYVFWADKMRHDADADVFFRYSKNGGTDWSQVGRVNQDVNGTKDQFMPHASADPKNGNVYVVYYDRRNSTENLFLDVYLAELNKGKINREVRVNNTASPPAGKDVFFGDYIAVASSGKQIGLAYTLVREALAVVETRNFEGSALRQRQAFVPQPYLELYKEKRSDWFYIHYAYPGVKTFSLRLYRMNELVYSQGFNKPFAAEGDVKLPRSRFRSGLYEAVMESNLGKVSTRFYLD